MMAKAERFVGDKTISPKAPGATGGRGVPGFKISKDSGLSG